MSERKRRIIAKGAPHGQQLRAQIAFDAESFAEVARFAERSGTSFAAAVRLLVQFGLLDAAEAEAGQ